MDAIELFKKAAAAMQTDERYLALDAARRANDENKELQDMIERDGGAQVKCHFCNAVYEFTAAELSDLLRMAKSEDNGQNAT